MITFLDLLPLFRFEISDNDNVNGYRFSNKDIESWYIQAVRMLFARRPDLRINSNFTLQDPETYSICYEKKGVSTPFSMLDKITGIDITIPSPLLIEHHINDDFLTVRHVGEGRFPFTAGIAVITPGPVNGLGGYLQVGRLQNIDFAYRYLVNITLLDVEERYIRAILYAMCYYAYYRDNEDTNNSQRASLYLQLFTGEIALQ
jgi:hypothetical protein